MDFLTLLCRAPYTAKVSAIFPLDTISEMDYDDSDHATEP
jgi:hypothetical protein